MTRWLLSTSPLWQGAYVDLWSIPHFLFGMLVGVAAFLLQLPFPEGLLACIAVAVLWEFFEKATGLSRVEYFSNHISDIVVAAVGFIVIAPFFGRLSSGTVPALGISLLAAFAAFCALGWYVALNAPQQKLR